MRYRFGDYALDTETFALTRAGEPVSVEPRVFDLLAYLIEHRDRVVPKEELVREVWSGAFITDAALKRAIVEARRAIGDDGRQQVAIQTLYGRGYRFVKEAAEEPATLPGRSPPAVRRWLIGLASLAGALLLIVVVLFLAGAWPVRERVRPAAVLSADRIAVFPFSVRGSEELTYLGEGIVHLLSANLEGAGELRTIDPRAVLSAVIRARSDPPNPEGLRRLATQLGAGFYVVGDIVEAGGRLRMNARLYQLPAADGKFAAASVEGTPDALFGLVDVLTAQLLAGRIEGAGEGFARLAARTTDSLEALKAYVEGERQYRNGRGYEAIEALERATRIDPTFALAYYRQAAILGFYSQTESAAAIERAAHYSERLGGRTRRLIAALQAFSADRHAEAYASYRQIVTEYPSEVEAWFFLGKVIFLRGMFLGRSWDEAREAFERSIALDPDHVPSLAFLASIAARGGRRDEFDALSDRLLRLGPPSWEWWKRMERAILFGDARELEQFEAQLRRFADRDAQWRAGIVTWTTGNLSVGRRLWRLLTQPDRAPGLRALAHMTLAKFEVTEGRWRAAKRELEALEAVDQALALEYRTYFALARFLPVARQELEVLRVSLVGWEAVQNPVAGSNGSNLIALHGPTHPYLRLYLLGLLSARLGDQPTAVECAEKLERLGPTSHVPHYVADLARSVRMEAAWLEGRLEEALAILEEASFWRFVELSPSDSPFYGHSYERLARAELLYELGRYDEALRWHQAMADRLVYGGGLSHLRLAELYQRRGETEEAARHYQRFIELWRECDPELRALVEEAEERVARLESKRGAQGSPG